MELRRPTPEDAARVWQLVRNSGRLDLNSPYAYLLLCSDFASTCLIAEHAGRVVGFVAAYRPPRAPEAVFVWQIVTAPSMRGRGLGGRMLDALITWPACADATHLEATVTPSNGASRALFRRFAERRDAAFREQCGFGSELFPEANHEEEIRIRIGPLAERRAAGGSLHAHFRTSRV